MRPEWRLLLALAPAPIAAATVLALLTAAQPFRACRALTIFPATTAVGQHGGKL